MVLLIRCSKVIYRKSLKILFRSGFYRKYNQFVVRSSCKKACSSNKSFYCIVLGFFFDFMALQKSSAVRPKKKLFAWQYLESDWNVSASLSQFSLFSKSGKLGLCRIPLIILKVSMTRKFLLRHVKEFLKL